MCFHSSGIGPPLARSWRSCQREVDSNYGLKKGIATNDHRARLVLSKRCESAFEIICLAGSHDKNLHAKALCGVLNVFRLILRVGITRIAIGEALGTISCSRASLLEPSRAAYTLTPVALPPGRLRLATSPALTGSSPVVKTIGTVVVAALAARAEMVPPVAAKIVTPRSTSSAISAGSRSS